MNIISQITTMDTKITLWINHHYSPVLDKIMQFITDIDNWKLFFLLPLVGLFILGRRKGRLVAISLLIATLISDNLTSYVLKPFFNRPRPFITIDEIRTQSLPPKKVPSPSFPSCHAANTFAVALVLSIFFKKTWPIWFFMAGMVGYSRVYLGVHYFLDVIGGIIVGISCGFLVSWMVRKISFISCKNLNTG